MAETSPRRPVPWVTLLIAALAIFLSFQPAMADRLPYVRERVLAGEWWRMWSAHLVHFGPGHLGWNLLVFVPASAWAERLAPGRTRLLLALAPGFIGLALVAFDPTLTRYAGLSGLAASALALLAFLHLRARDADRWFWGGVLGLLLVKIAAEAVLGQALFAHFATGEIQPVPLAHLAGIAAAAIAGWGRQRG